jgi:hypothetical protein
VISLVISRPSFKDTFSFPKIGKLTEVRRLDLNNFWYMPMLCKFDIPSFEDRGLGIRIEKCWSSMNHFDWRAWGMWEVLRRIKVPPNCHKFWISLIVCRHPLDVCIWQFIFLSSEVLNITLFFSSTSYGCLLSTLNCLVSIEIWKLNLILKKHENLKIAYNLYTCTFNVGDFSFLKQVQLFLKQKDSCWKSF